MFNINRLVRNNDIRRHVPDASTTVGADIRTSPTISNLQLGSQVRYLQSRSTSRPIASVEMTHSVHHRISPEASSDRSFKAINKHADHLNGSRRPFCSHVALSLHCQSVREQTGSCTETGTEQEVDGSRAIRKARGTLRNVIHSRSLKCSRLSCVDLPSCAQGFRHLPATSPQWPSVDAESKSNPFVGPLYCALLGFGLLRQSKARRKHH